MITNPALTTIGDLCTAALKETGALGVGQSPLAEEINDAWARMQWMLQEWERKRWLVYHLVTLSVPCTGAASYTIGPDGDINTNQFNSQFAPQFGQSVRPARIETAFVRQITPGVQNPPDYFLEQLQAREDYDRLVLKNLSTIPSCFFWDSAWPLGSIYPWPIPSNLYTLYVSIMEQLPTMFASVGTYISLPYEYYSAIVSNLALRLKPVHGLTVKPGDPLVGMAKNSLNVLRGANTQIGRLVMPGALASRGVYNIFSDQV